MVGPCLPAGRFVGLEVLGDGSVDEVDLECFGGHQPLLDIEGDEAA